MSDIYTVFHPTTCECGADLTQSGAVRVTITTNSGIAGIIDSRVYPSGLLEDRDGDIALGLHGGSLCTACGEQVEELLEDDNAPSPDGATVFWCETNDCERPGCHRCFPRRDCVDHAKCRDFTRDGEAYSDADAARLGR